MGTKNFDNYSDLITFTRASSGTALRPISYGDELVTNGTFDTDLSGWTDTSELTGSATWNSGAVDLFNDGGDITKEGRIEQSFTTVVGKTYSLTCSRSGLS